MVNSALRSWKRLQRRMVYTNPWITVHEDQVQLPNGSSTLYGVVESKTEFVGLVPLLDSETVILVRQYRYIQNEVTWEIPSGGIEKHEKPEDAAQRELREEVGYRADHLTLLSIMHSNKSLMEDKGYIFLAEGLVPSQAAADETEVFEIVPVSLARAIDMVKRFEITDCVSIIGLLFAGNYVKSQ